MDTLDLDSDYVDVTSRFDTMKTYLVGERKFTLTGRVRPWKKKDRS